MTSAPRLSIGLPVYNGERYLGQAIESIQGQTFTDYELIIYDNGSTDATEDICRTFAEQDVRIKYHRNPQNIGAASNYNLTFSHARGEFFKWAAHDDQCEPSFFQSCIEILDREPSVSLCSVKVSIIDEKGAEIERHVRANDFEDTDPIQRFKVLLRGHKCFEVFGIMRTATLKQTGLIGSFARSDGVLLAELGLHGPFREVPDYLFCARRHEGQSMRMIGDWAIYAEWFDPSKKGKIQFPTWRVLCEFGKAVRRAPLTPSQRLQCYRILADCAFTRKWALARDVKHAGVRFLTGSVYDGS